MEELKEEREKLNAQIVLLDAEFANTVNQWLANNNQIGQDVIVPYKSLTESSLISLGSKNSVPSNPADVGLSLLSLAFSQERKDT